MNPLPVVAGLLGRSRGASVVVIALVALAVAIGVAVSCQERALRAGSARAAEPFDLVVGARGSPTQLVLSTVYLQPAMLELIPGRTLRDLASDPGVAYVAPLVFGDSVRGLPIVGSTIDLVTRGGQRALAEGRAFASDREAIVGSDVPLAIGDRFIATHGLAREKAHDAPTHGGDGYTVVGRAARLGSPWDRAAIVPVEAMWRLHVRPRGHTSDSERIGPPWEAEDIGEVSAVVVAPRSVADAYRLRTRYRAQDTMALFPAEVLVELYGYLGDVRDGLELLARLTEGLVLVSVLLALSATLAHRRRELGVLRALGASRVYVFSAVWAYVTVLLVSGAALGLLLGGASAHVLATLFEARTGIAASPMVSWREIGMVAALSGVGAVLALIPSWRAYREPVARALHA